MLVPQDRVNGVQRGQTTPRAPVKTQDNKQNNKLIKICNLLAVVSEQ